MNDSRHVARKFEQKRWYPDALEIANEPFNTPAECWLSLSWLTCALSKSFSPFAAVGAAVTYGNGTLLVSWLMYRSTVPRPRGRTEIPSGIDSNRYPLGSTSPTVISGVTVTSGATAVSIAGCAVLKPPVTARMRCGRRGRDRRSEGDTNKDGASVHDPLPEVVVSAPI